MSKHTICMLVKTDDRAEIIVPIRIGQMHDEYIYSINLYMWAASCQCLREVCIPVSWNMHSSLDKYEEVSKRDQIKSNIYLLI